MSLTGSQVPTRGRVAVVEDDPALSRTIADLLRHEGHQVATFATGEAFLAKSAILDGFDGVLLDLRLPGMSGLDVLSKLAEAAPSLSVLVLTGHADVRRAVDAMKLGAVDFLEKPYRPAALLAAVEKACERSAQLREADAANREAAAALASLTGRQRQVLEGMTRGESSKVMAEKLGLSIRTVEMHRAHLLDRLGARTSLDAVRLALEAGFPGD